MYHFQDTKMEMQLPFHNKCMDVQSIFQILTNWPNSLDWWQYLETRNLFTTTSRLDKMHNNGEGVVSSTDE